MDESQAATGNYETTTSLKTRAQFDHQAREQPHVCFLAADEKIDQSEGAPPLSVGNFGRWKFEGTLSRL